MRETHSLCCNLRTTIHLDDALSFTSIVGGNGAGKSALVEALAFALGVRSAALRSSKLENLINADRLASDTPLARVQLTFSSMSSTTMVLERSIVMQKDGAVSLYRVDGKKLSAAAGL